MSPRVADADPRARAAQSSLPAVAGVDLAAVAKDYSAAVSRVLAARPWKYLVADAVGILLSGFFAYGVVAGRLATAEHSVPRSAVALALGLYLVTVLACAAFLYVMGGVVQVTPDSVDLTAPQRSPRYLTAQVTTLSLARRGWHGFAVVTIGLSVVVVACAAAATRRVDVTLAAARLSSLGVAVALVPAMWEWGQLTGSGLARRRGADRPRPLDRVATQLVVVAARVWRCAQSPGEVDQARVRAQVDALERAARDAERFALPRAPWWDGDARRAARMDGLRLATVIRAHKPLLARAMSAEDFATVARSLTGGLGAWSCGDFPSMVRGAPEVDLPSRIPALLTRLAPALTLAGLAVVLPMLPPLNATAQAASSARASLFVGAILALITGTVQVDAYLNTVLSRK